MYGGGMMGGYGSGMGYGSSMGMGGYGSSGYGSSMGMGGGMQQQQQQRQPGQRITGAELAIQGVATVLNTATQLMQIAAQGAVVGVSAWSTYAQMRNGAPELFGAPGEADAAQFNAAAPAGTGAAASAAAPGGLLQSRAVRRVGRPLVTYAICAVLYALVTRLWRRLSGPAGGETAAAVAAATGSNSAVASPAAARPAAPLGERGREVLRQVFQRLDEACRGRPRRGWVVESLLDDEEAARILEGSREEQILEDLAEGMSSEEAARSVLWDEFDRELFRAGGDATAADWVAMYEYKAQRDDEVSLTQHDRVTVLDQKGAAEGWWHVAVASAAGEKRGLCPANYLTQLAQRNKF